MRDLRGASVVVTGASSGIGRAAALAFARRGARVARAARRAKLLEEVAAECRAAGADAFVVPTDVSDPEAVGGSDVWINSAGTGVFGPLLDASLELHRRTVEGSFLGALHGAYAVLPRGRRARCCGRLRRGAA